MFIIRFLDLSKFTFYSLTFQSQNQYPLLLMSGLSKANVQKQSRDGAEIIVESNFLSVLSIRSVISY